MAPRDCFAALCSAQDETYLMPQGFVSPYLLFDYMSLANRIQKVLRQKHFCHSLQLTMLRDACCLHDPTAT
jgi:hypothetical protein